MTLALRVQMSLFRRLYTCLVSTTSKYSVSCSSLNNHVFTYCEPKYIEQMMLKGQETEYLLVVQTKQMQHRSSALAFSSETSFVYAGIHSQTHTWWKHSDVFSTPTTTVHKVGQDY